MVKLPSDLIKFIEAPECFPKGNAILPRLADILRIIILILDGDNTYDLERFKQWKIDCEDYTKELVPHDGSLKGCYENHQPYVTLSYKPTDLKLIGVHNHLIAQLLIANHACREREHDGDGFDSSRKAAFTFCRTISKGERIHDLGCLPVEPCAPTQYLELLNNAGFPHGSRIQSFIVFIRYALGLRNPITHDAGVLAERLPQVINESLDLLEYKQPVQTITILKDSMHTPSQESQLEKSGLSLDEFTSQNELHSKSYDEDKPMGGRSSVEHVFRAKNTSKHIEMYNQQLGDRWSQLTKFEAVVVGKEIAELFRCGKSGLNLNLPVQEIELAALLTMMFWFSSSFKEAILATVYSSFTERIEPPIAYIRDSGSGYLMIRSASPKYKQSNTKYDAHPISDHIALVSGISVESIISAHCDGLKSGHKIFSEPEGVYQESLKLFVKNINEKHGCRITESRISTYLFGVIASTPKSDICCAMMITGKMSSLGSTQLHYTSLPGKYLLNIFQEACVSISSEIRDEFKSEGRDYISSDDLPLQQAMYGAKFRPPIVQVTELCKGLQERVKESLKYDLRVFHNAITLYTLAFINFSTGFRAVVNSSFSIHEIDVQTGFAVISDKDSDDNYHSRPVWIHGECLKQIVKYRKHLFNLLEFTAIHLPNTHNELSLKLHKKNAYEGKLPELFLISSDDKWRALKPSEYETEIIKMFRFPANCHRHFLRSNLLEMGCPREAIDAFMGHWERGQEPWGKYSAMSLVDYRSVMQPLITKLLSECGWKVI